MQFSGRLPDGLTHVLRGKDHLNNTQRQAYLFQYFGWKVPHYTHYGLVSVPDAILKTSTVGKGIKTGEYSGWDDVRLGTVRALAKRGFRPEAIRNYWVDCGIKETDVEFSWDNIYAYNKAIVDKTANRYFFVWDPVEKKLEQTLPLSKDTNVSAMTVAEGKVFFVSRPSNELSVFDIQSGQIVGSYPIPYGAIVEVAMGLHTDGMIYALTRTGVVRIDPKTCEIVQMAKYEGRVRCGFVMNQDGIYFASGVHLVKWSWPEG